MKWLERQIAKLDKKIGNIEAWWAKADFNKKALVVFGAFIAIVAVVEVTKRLV